jgi:hypothetical protein
MDRLAELKAKHWASDVETLERWKSMYPVVSRPLHEWLDRHISELRAHMIERYGKTACKGL